MLVFGEHAREFLPVELFLHLLKNFTQGYRERELSSVHQYSRFVLDHIELYLIGMLNPDGRAVVEKRKNYCWRGTSNGVDINRNFPWEFNGLGSSNEQNSEEYNGGYPFSEPEARVIKDYLNRERFHAFLSMHSGTSHIYVPFADSYSLQHGRKHWNLEEELYFASLMSSKLRGFKYGIPYDLLKYTADGTLYDYAAGVANVSYSFAVELWGNDTKACFETFNPANEELEATLSELDPLFEVLFLELVDHFLKIKFRVNNAFDQFQSANQLQRDLFHLQRELYKHNIQLNNLLSAINKIDETIQTQHFN